MPFTLSNLYKHFKFCCSESYIFPFMIHVFYLKNSFPIPVIKVIGRKCKTQFEVCFSLLAI